MITLPNNCRCSQLTVFPKNWKTKKASTNIPWRISYRFYDQDGNQKQKQIKGMNDTQDLTDRQIITEKLLENEINLLKSGYNPFTGHIVSPLQLGAEISEYTPMVCALEMALKFIECEPSTYASIESAIRILSKAATKLNIHQMAIGQVMPKHILLLLRQADSPTRLSASTYNHYRSYLMMLFKQLFILGASQSNPVRDIPKRKATKKIKTTLTKEQRHLVDRYLKEADYFFWRYMRIFFHSGGRSTELLGVKVKDVYIDRQQYKVIVKKGREKTEVLKTITKSAVPFWSEAIAGANPDDYVFGWGLKPGPRHLGADRVTKRWYYMIKKPRRFGIEASFYALKHANTTEVVDMLGEKKAAELNSHKSTAMVVKIYDTRQEERAHERLKEINNEFL